MATTKYLVIGLDEQKYAIELNSINGIEKQYVIVPVPEGPEFIKGIIHLRDQIVPIYNLKKRFGLLSRAAHDAQVLISDTHGMKLGIEVDVVYGIVELDENEIKDMPRVAKNEGSEYFEKIIKVSVNGSKEQIVICVNVDDLMSDEEFDLVSKSLDSASSDEE